MSEQSTFEARVSDLVDLHLGPNDRDDSCAPLLSLLGCYSIQKPGEKWVVHQPAQPAQEHHALVLEALLHSLRWFVRVSYPNEFDAFSLFDGLARAKNWRHCLSSVDDAYDLVALLIHVPLATEALRTAGASDEQVLEATTPIDTILRQWLPAASISSGNFTVAALARTLFGDAWCELVLGDTDLFDREIAYLVRTKRPDFLPGILDAYRLPNPEMNAAPERFAA